MGLEQILKIAILGAGESGVGAAILAKQKGHKVFVSDKGQIKEHYKAELNQHGIAFEEGSHDQERILAMNLIIKSPGIPDKAPLLQEIHRKGLPVISEIEFAARYTQSFTIGITGSNGKTTTTNLIYHLLATAGKDVAMGGNVGKSFARIVAERDYPFYVLELSSFQLEGIQEYRPDIAMLLNITPDHLDRYEYQLEKYAAAKFNIIKAQEATDTFLYNADDPILGALRENYPTLAKTISLSFQMTEGTRLNVGGFNFEMSTTPLMGRHNYMNALFAVQTALQIGIAPKVIQEGLNTFVNAPHRLEKVATVNGVNYINDSKATNVDSVFYALEAMTQPTVWIVGGQDKGNDYAPLLDFVKAKVKAIVCMGLDNSKILQTFSGMVENIVETRSAVEAVQRAAQFASTGDTVLLSPACASFDLFQNYEDRGNQFKAAVLEL
ncbi:UDP-N-acetylmuramoyl-L-alanine--D-glutamate ligase [Haliscomenobacter sp.]|uniref:UDP-N-acetylmuramoyl-L-alanine--D-glutamate ligase n=1 Tax=Haliscomenobacter sp. TaxID=2717303 RepID=UPI0033652D96